MEKFLFSKIEFWLVALVFLVVMPLCIAWGMRIVEDEAWPWSVIKEVREFVAGDEVENTSLAAKLKSQFGGTDRFEVAPEEDAGHVAPATPAKNPPSVAFDRVVRGTTALLATFSQLRSRGSLDVATMLPTAVP